MVDLVHNFAARKCKRGASYKRMADTLPEVTREVRQPLSGVPSETQAIGLLDSLDMGFQG